MSLIQPFRCVRGVRNRGIENGHDPNFHLRTPFTHTHAHTSHTHIHYSKLFLSLLSPLSPFYSRIAGTIIPLFLAIKRQEDANSRRVHERLGYPRGPGAKWSRVQDTGSPLSLDRDTWLAAIVVSMILDKGTRRSPACHGALLSFDLFALFAAWRIHRPLWNFVNIEMIFFSLLLSSSFFFFSSFRFFSFISVKTGHRWYIGE